MWRGAPDTHDENSVCPNASAPVFALIDMACELACNEAVLRQFNHDTIRSYGASLLAATRTLVSCTVVPHVGSTEPRQDRHPL